MANYVQVGQAFNFISVLDAKQVNLGYQEERGAAAQEAGLPSGLVKPSAGVGDSLNLALVLS